jgi:hypothetical protein
LFLRKNVKVYNLRLYDPKLGQRAGTVKEKEGMQEALSNLWEAVCCRMHFGNTVDTSRMPLMILKNHTESRP